MVSLQSTTLVGHGNAEAQRRSGGLRLLALEGAAWDERLIELGGQLHQSWTWGEFRSRHGRRVERIAVDGDAGTAMAQVQLKHQGPVSTAFLSRGPLVRGDASVVLPPLWREIEHACRRHRAILMHVEAETQVPLQTILGHEPYSSDNRVTPRRTVVVPLADDETLLQQMHASKRREVRKALRRDITIELGSAGRGAMDTFYQLMEDTSLRNSIRINPKAYYADFLRLHGEGAALMLAVADGKVAAGLIASAFGDTGTYVFGASSTAHRVSGATALLQFTAMQWARGRGCTKYDLWGIPDEDPQEYIDSEGNPIRSVGDNFAGLYRFKVEFGGPIVTYPPSFEIRYRPGMSWAMRKVKDLGHAPRA